MKAMGYYDRRDFEVSVVVTAVASNVDYLEEAAFEAAKSAFQAYRVPQGWTDAKGNRLAVQIESEITPLEWSSGDKWRAEFRVGRLLPESLRRNRP